MELIEIFRRRRVARPFIAERMAEAGLGVRLVRLGLRDTYAHGASKAYLQHEYGLDALSIVRAVETLTGATTGIEAGGAA